MWVRVDRSAHPANYIKSNQIKHIYFHFIILNLPLKFTQRSVILSSFSVFESVYWDDRVRMLERSNRAEKSSTLCNFKFSLNEYIHILTQTHTYIYIYPHTSTFHIHIHNTHTHYVCVYIYIYKVHTVEGFENNQNICEKLSVFIFNIHYNTSRFWLVILI